MFRNIEKSLNQWLQAGAQKPLMIIGVRQIGKTWTIDNFCKKSKLNYLFFDLEKDLEIKEIFETTRNPDDVIKYIEYNIGKKIDIDKTIFFFDECQVSEQFISSLKYFSESKVNYKIICAGSLLGVKINRFKSSFPVGKVDILSMYPMDFEEFLLASDKSNLIPEIKKCFIDNKPLLNSLHEQLMDLYRDYLCVGGMPEAVGNYNKNNADILLFDKKILNNIRVAYLADMNKYVNNSAEATKIERTYLSIVRQLGKPNKKFLYKIIEKNAIKRNYQSAIEWLLSSKMLIDVYKVSFPQIPLEAYKNIDSFKLYFSDVGILTNIAEINYSDIKLNKDYIFKGALTENYVGQQFMSKNISRYYWESNGQAEVDFLLYQNSAIIPVEVKSGTNIRSRSLYEYIGRYAPSYAIRISANNFGIENNIKSIPLYAVFCIE